MGQPVVHFEVVWKDGDKLRTDPEWSRDRRGQAGGTRVS
jgi:hypothetical protein